MGAATALEGPGFAVDGCWQDGCGFYPTRARGTFVMSMLIILETLVVLVDELLLRAPERTRPAGYFCPLNPFQQGLASLFLSAQSGPL